MRPNPRAGTHAPPFAPPEQGEQAPTGEVSSGKTFADVVGEYRSTFMITDLKVTTRRGYDAVFEGILLPRFGDRPFGKVDGAAAAERPLAPMCRKSRFVS